MKRMMPALLIAAAMSATGCAEQMPGRTKVLGSMSYDDAFAAGRAVMAKHYEVASADPAKGAIVCAPKSIDAAPERLLGGNSPAREIARLHIQRNGQMIVAQLSIEVQRQGESVQRVTGSAGDTYSGVPDQTPAQGAGATTPQQNANWQHARYNHEREARLLQELYDMLHPKE